ncbi:LysR family transcriptional regulator [Klebsiella variicola subsp. variicola]|nr:LysR family transcriptional regulator [Klebsiella variicola subsp. variicola]
MHLDFRQLRNFVALVEYGSFNRAAEAVCLSQSAFSRSIQALEQSVGHPLFDRQSKLPTLTLHGQKLLPYARRFQELNIELSSQLREADDAQNGEVAFGCGPAPGARLIPAAIGEFHRLCRRRGCVFTLITGLLCIRRLPPSTILFVVADSWQAELDPQLRVQPLSPQRCFFVCHAEHPLAKQGTISIQEMLRYPLPPLFAAGGSARYWRPSASNRTLRPRSSATIFTRCFPLWRKPTR